MGKCTNCGKSCRKAVPIDPVTPDPYADSGTMIYQLADKVNELVAGYNRIIEVLPKE